MASIQNAKLAITVDSKKETARCVVTGRVHFSEYEMSQIQQGLKFRLHCSLWGGDWLTADDLLFNFNSKYFPDSTPSSTENFEFVATVGTSLLDEDPGKDEVYAKLVLVNTYNDKTVVQKTNEIKQKF